MNRPPHPRSKVSPHPAVRDVPLVIKDGLRELRFSAKRSAKRWMEEMEGVLFHIPKVGPTLGAATKTASQILQFADRAAVDSLSTENPHRRGDFRLPPPDLYLDVSDKATMSKLFIKNYYWALKHLLKLKNKTDFFVLEESIFQAYHQFIGTQAQDAVSQDAVSQDSLPPFATSASKSSLLSARIIDALYRSKPLLHHGEASQEPEALTESTATLTLHTCISVVLAGEITPFFPNASAQIETLEALKLADEVCGAKLERWENAILHRSPIQQLALELDFTIRHI